MKKHLLAIMLMAPCLTWAQSEWEVPDYDKKEASSIINKAKAKKKAKAIDAKYAIGAVPEVEGKAEWQKTFDLTAKNGEEIYEKSLQAIKKLIAQKEQTAKSRISAVNKRERIIAANMVEEMVFSTSAFAKDFTHFRYTIIAECQDNKACIKLCRISYKYDIGRQEEQTYTAEELITDKQAINKKGTKMYKMNGKFRKQTIDRIDAIWSFFDNEFKN